MKYHRLIQCTKLQIHKQSPLQQRRRTPIPIQTSFFSSTSKGTQQQNSHPDKRQTKIQVIGNQNEYDAVKQCRLIELPDQYHPHANLVASMHVKRNIIFGTRVHDVESYLKYRYTPKKRGEKDELLSDTNDCSDEGINGDYRSTEKEDDPALANGMCSTKNNWGFVKICKPLLKHCLDQAGVEGDQPQGLAALGGLSAHVRYMIDHPSESKAMERLQAQSPDVDENKIVYEAVLSVAKQVPRAGHDILGLGTYLDSRVGWTELAKEYALKRKGHTVVQGESQLFQSSGAVLVGIEFIGEENPDYWIDSGGAMARFIFT